MTNETVYLFDASAIDPRLWIFWVLRVVGVEDFRVLEWENCSYFCALMYYYESIRPMGCVKSYGTLNKLVLFDIQAPSHLLFIPITFEYSPVMFLSGHFPNSENPGRPRGDQSHPLLPSKTPPSLTHVSKITAHLTAHSSNLGVRPSPSVTPNSLITNRCSLDGNRTHI